MILHKPVYTEAQLDILFGHTATQHVDPFIEEKPDVRMEITCRVMGAVWTKLATLVSLFLSLRSNGGGVVLANV